MVVLEFKGYRVLKMDYERNLEFDPSKDETGFSPKINISFNTELDDVASVILSFTSKGELPFNIDVKLEGDFKYNAEEDKDNFGFEDLIKKNATAILFPYFRMIISQLTGMSGEYPSLVLPTMNISNLIDKNS